jgi:hypothetical protein
MAFQDGPIRNISNPSLPVAPTVYEQRFMDQYSNVLRLFQNQVANAINAPYPHGSFYDTTTQTNPVANAVNLMKWNRVYDSGDGTQYAVQKDTTRVYITQTGVYNIQFSAQLDKTGGGASAVYIWIRVNGQNVPNSATKMVIDGPNSEVVAAWNWMLTLRANDYIELAWESSDTNVVLAAVAASGNIPEIPSVILTVMWVSNTAIRNANITQT